MGRSQHLSRTIARKLPLDDLAELSLEIGQTLAVIFKVSTTRATIGTERKMAKAIDAAWKRAANSSLNQGLNQLFTRGEVTQQRLRNFLRKLDVDLAGPLTAAQVRVLRSRLRSIWRTSKRIAAREVKVKVDFSLVDTRAIAALNQQQVFWVGDFYGDKLSRRIAAVSEDVIFRQGLDSREAGRVLRQALDREFGITAGGATRFASAVPARYAGNPDFYFRQVASTASHQARTFAKITQFSEAEITRYRLINPNDERTGRICRTMSGQVFQVQTGVRHMQRILTASNPKAVKGIAPWLSGEELEEVVEGERKGSTGAADALARSGAILPPFHSLCRTEPVVIS